MGGRLTGLDALRGVAAVIVLVFHLELMFDSPDLFPKGYLAVDFFFALSGYVMARAYEERMRSGWQLRFIAARIKRFAPMVLLGGTIALPLFVYEFGPIALIVAVFNLLLIPVPVGRMLFPLNPPFWSLFYELAANVAHAGALSRWGDRAVLLGAAVCFAVMVPFAAQNGSVSFGTLPETFFLGFPRVGFSYLIGIWAARNWNDCSPLPGWLAPTVLLIGLGIIGHGGAEQWWLELVFLAIGVPVILSAGLNMSGPRWLGNVSFPLYVIHMPVLLLGSKFQLSAAMAGSLAVVMALLVTLGMNFRRKVQSREPSAAN